MTISYQFTVAERYDRVRSAILYATELCGCSARSASVTGFSFKLSPGSCSFKIKFTVFFAESNGTTTIRITTSGSDGKSHHFRAYDRFLEALTFTGLPVPVVPGEPYIVTASQIGGGIEQSYSGKSSPSLSGALAGGLLFGDVGAMIGGVGNSRTNGRVKTVFSNSALFLICYSNGMVEEREVKKGTRQYTEVMAKLGADPVIQKPKKFAEPDQSSCENHTSQNERNKNRKNGFFTWLLVYALSFVVLLFLAVLIPVHGEPMSEIRAVLVLVLPALIVSFVCG